MTRALVGIAALSFGLAGCGGDQHPPYSANIKFGLRKDPIIKKAIDLGVDGYDTDRPGVLPIMKTDDLFNHDHPYHAKMMGDAMIAKAASLFAADKKNDDERKKLQDETVAKIKASPLPYRRDLYLAFMEVLRAPELIAAEDRDKLETTLDKMFGTPAKPTINAEFAGIDKDEIKKLKLDDDTLAMGSRHYRVHCMHCHGVAGDGRGPTARWVNPHPRDFRSGIFKFMSVDRSTGGFMPPSRADLMRTLRQGIEGTAMPSFTILDDDHLETIISYVMFLSLRGNTELAAIMDLEVDVAAKALKAPKANPIPENIKFWTKKIFDEGWSEANKASAQIVVADYPYTDTPKELADSVQRGQMIFTATPSAKFKEEFFNRMRSDGKVTDDAVIESKFNEVTGVKCVTCHVDYGRQVGYKFDEWGTLVRPNNFAIGVFRGGRRPVDIYFRIHSGIQGSEMPPFAKNFKGQERYLWDVINFVRVAGYPAMHKTMGIRLEP
jgi:mono/diheme cytochrome c family protein